MLFNYFSFNRIVGRSDLETFCAPKKKLVIIGGGFGGAAVAGMFNNDKHLSVTLVDPKSYFENICALYKVITEPFFIRNARMFHKEYVPNIEHCQSYVKSITEKSILLADNSTLDYDYLVISSGCSYSKPITDYIASDNVVSLTDGSECLKSNGILNKSTKIAVIGAGPAGIEVAAEIAERFPNKEVTLISHSQHFLPRYSLAHEKIEKYFCSIANIKTIFGEKAVTVNKNGSVITDKGTFIPSQLTFVCAGLKPNSAFCSDFMSKCLDSQNYIKVNENMQVQGHNNIFAIGDIVSSNEEKLAGRAFFHAKIVTENIKLSRGQTDLVQYFARDHTVHIGLGPYNAISVGKNEIFTGYKALQRRHIKYTSYTLVLKSYFYVY